MSQLYYNGTIITMDEKNKTTEAVLVEDGLIKKCGKKDELLSLTDTHTELIDLQGMIMMPGFIDGHSHFSGVATSLSQCDLSQVTSFDELIKAMKDFITTNHIQKGQWVIGTNYDHNFLKEQRHPDKFVLDQISTEYPIVVIHASSHMGAANSLALKLQNLTEETNDPVGGMYGRVENTKELTGYMEENAFVTFRNHMPMPRIEDLLALFKKAQIIYAKNGFTTVQEGMVTKELFQLLQYAQSTQLFYLDLVGYIDLENSADTLRKNIDYTKGYKNHFKIGGYKIFLDGSPQGRTAWMKAPYEGANDGYCGYPIKTDQKLYEEIEMALNDNQQLLTHCNGDAAAEQLVTQFEKVVKDKNICDTNRPVMIHAQFVQKEQLERMKALNMMPSFFIAHIYYWGDIHIKNMGLARAQNISPAQTAVSLNLPFTLHQDSPVLHPSVLEPIWCAITRRTKDGVVLAKDQQISIYEALKAMTIYAAYQYREEDKKGSIEEGKLADLVILNKNPLECTSDTIRTIKVLKTIKEGNVIYDSKSES